MTEREHREWIANKRKEFLEARSKIEEIKEPDKKEKLLSTLEMFEQFADELEEFLDKNAGQV